MKVEISEKEYRRIIENRITRKFSLGMIFTICYILLIAILITVTDDLFNTWQIGLFVLPVVVYFIYVTVRVNKLTNDKWEEVKKKWKIAG